MVSSTEDMAMQDYLARIAEAGVDPPGSRQAEETQLDEGATLVHQPKGRGTIRFNGMAMPDRIPVRDRLGNWTRVSPTVAMKRVQGQRVFFEPEEYDRRVARGDLPRREDPTYIAETCEICNTRRALEGNKDPRRFTTIQQYRAHMNGFHQQEFADETAERRERAEIEERAMMRALLEKVTGESFTPPPAKIPVVYYCDMPECDRYFDSEQGVTMHKRTGHPKAASS